MVEMQKSSMTALKVSIVILLINCFHSADCVDGPGFSESNANVMEGSNFNFEFEYENIGPEIFTCMVSQVGFPPFVSVMPPSVTLMSGNPPVSFTLSLQDLDLENCEVQSGTVELQCPGLSAETFNTEQIRVTVRDNSGAACSDPHLSQRVRGSDEKFSPIMTDICYDLYGKAGEQYEIISDSRLDASVIFELRDDYYIGRVLYRCPSGLLVVNTTSIEMPNGKVFDWNNIKNFPHQELFSTNDLFVEFQNNFVKIINSKNSRTLDLEISKVDQKYGKKYLNIIIGKKTTTTDGTFDKFHGGLFGEIANKNFQFFEPVQSDTKTVVKIDGRYTNSWLSGQKLSSSNKCYHLEINDIIFPKTLKSFMSSI